jgi:hypothetical protein
LYAMDERKEVSVLELKKLLVDLMEKRPDICIRIRQQGAMWQTSFTRVLTVKESGTILFSESLNRFYRITNLRTIIQFEIDHGFQIYKPHFHYDVILLENEFN